MPEPHPLRPGPCRNAHPIEPAKERSSQPSNETSSDHIVGRHSPLGIVRNEIDDIKDDCGTQQAEREDDEHRMNGMPQEFYFAFHTGLAPAVLWTGTVPAAGKRP